MPCAFLVTSFDCYYVTVIRYFVLVVTEHRSHFHLQLSEKFIFKLSIITAFSADAVPHKLSNFQIEILWMPWWLDESSLLALINTRCEWTVTFSLLVIIKYSLKIILNMLFSRQ